MLIVLNSLFSPLLCSVTSVVDQRWRPFIANEWSLTRAVQCPCRRRLVVNNIKTSLAVYWLIRCMAGLQDLPAAAAAVVA